ncbi:hypothetical protein AUEXF2481DRAFT_253347 [Aureobasidium subglaciale EXF-2481]|uniref:Uncharacterized protein n=1 Tax=Aureobasidium subglaciale (strain EXF-2481) TaxID=1043005 RepID=A0A074YAC0_AURSE|nr:uncharacterized protein AUEXF2481DRAFT_253347 [Aureobasidium subglaciale EXF-2481]KEQ94700.1 hypothetical protein AUEXF2481DRAFT_253347 [Aureobasidium subglaciale EXF-2481]
MQYIVSSLFSHLSILRSNNVTRERPLNGQLYRGGFPIVLQLPPHHKPFLFSLSLTSPHFFVLDLADTSASVLYLEISRPRETYAKLNYSQNTPYQFACETLSVPVRSLNSAYPAAQHINLPLLIHLFGDNRDALFDTLSTRFEPQHIGWARSHMSAIKYTFGIFVSLGILHETQTSLACERTRYAKQYLLRKCSPIAHAIKLPSLLCIRM